MDGKGITHALVSHQEKSSSLPPPLRSSFETRFYRGRRSDGVFGEGWWEKRVRFRLEKKEWIEEEEKE